MRHITWVGTLFVHAGVALAQPGTGHVWYEASADEGLTWQKDYLLVAASQTSVLVRIRAAWSGDAGMYAFAGMQYDVTISDAGSDVATDLTRPYPFGTIQAATLVATRFGSTIKIDDHRDTFAPGVGTRGIFSGQLIQMHLGADFSTANPATVFQFRLNLGDQTIRTLTSLYRPPTGGDTISRFMRVYTSPMGSQNTPVSTTSGMIIDNYTPAPGAALAIALAAGGACLRRRRPSEH